MYIESVNLFLVESAELLHAILEENCNMNQEQDVLELFGKYPIKDFFEILKDNIFSYTYHSNLTFNRKYLIRLTKCLQRYKYRVF